MKKKKAALSARPQQIATSKRVARAATGPFGAVDPQIDPLVELLVLSAEDPEAAALRLFPGRSTAQTLRRAAFGEIAAAARDGAAGVAWLEQAGGIVGGELGTVDSGPTLSEDAIVAARDLLASAVKSCGCALSAIRRVRLLARRPRLR